MPEVPFPCPQFAIVHDVVVGALRLTYATRRAVLAAAGIVACVAALLASETALASLPAPTGQVPASNKAAIQKLLEAATAAQSAGDLQRAIVLMKDILGAEPTNGNVRAILASLLLRSGDAASAESEALRARSDRADLQLVLPPLLQAMLARRENQMLLDEFSEPNANMAPAARQEILRDRAFAFQALNDAPSAQLSIERALAIRRDSPTLLAAARLSQLHGDLKRATTLDSEAISVDPRNFEAHLFAVDLAIASGNSSAALSLTDQLIKHFPDQLAAHAARAEVLLRRREQGAAALEIARLAKLAPNTPIVLYYQAVLRAQSGDLHGAWRIAQSLPEGFTQSSTSVALVVAGIAIGSGNIDTAATILTSAINRSPLDPDLRIQLAAIRLQQNDPAAALQVLMPVRDVGGAKVQSLLSQIYVRLGQFDDALAALDKLLANDANNVSLLRDRAVVRLKAGQTDQGLKDLVDLSSLHPTDPYLASSLVAALVEQHRYVEALSAADRLATDKRQLDRANFLRGQILLLQGDSEHALLAFQKSISINPRNVEALYYRASLFEARQRYPEAIRDLQAILAIDSKSVVALVKLAEVNARLGDAAQVKAILARAISLAPKDPLPRLAQARFEILQGDLVRASTMLRDFLRAEPRSTDALALQGQLNLSLGRPKDAVATFQRLAALLPRSARPQLLLANAFAADGNLAAAIGALSAAGNIEPDLIDVPMAQTNLLFAKGDVRAAVAAARAFQLANRGTEADLLLADTLRRANRGSEAEATLKESLARRPDGHIVVRLVQFAVLRGDQKAANKLFADWLGTHPRDIEVRIQYAKYLAQYGNESQAISQYEIVLKQDGDRVVALNDLAWLLRDSNSQRVIALLSHALALNPQSSDALDSLGWIKLRMGARSQALDLLTRAHQLSPGDGEIAYHLALTLDANGKRAEAKALLFKLLGDRTQFPDLENAKELAHQWS